MVVEKIPTEIKHEPARIGDVPSSAVSLEKARKLLSWEPRITFREGLDRLIDHYRKRNEIEE